MSQIISVVAVVAFAFLFIKLISTPMRWVMKLLINAAGGFVSLFLLNLLSGFTGITFELNLFSALLVGILGLPGVVILLVIKLFL
ncbi:MAG: pro-sigmaK processing inhibitor BofA [Ruminococcaceae bacterium]|nr:pro-sigmaK processing inhibitor BofA [Oscillospiraceae bacterium]